MEKSLPVSPEVYSRVRMDFMVHRATFPEYRIRPRYIANVELVLILRGTGKVTVEDKEYTVEAGDFFCFQPSVLHSLWVEEEPYMEFYGLHFWLPDAAEELPFPTYMHLDAPQRLIPLFRSLYEIHMQKDFLYEWKQQLLLQQILCEIFRILHTDDKPIVSLRIRKVLEYIQNNLHRPLTMEELLQQAGIHKTLFISSFRQVVGTTPKQYILLQRLEYAQMLLLETDLPIATLAERSGFADPLYFSRCFQKKFQLSPKQYREQHRK